MKRMLTLTTVVLVGAIAVALGRRGAKVVINYASREDAAREGAAFRMLVTIAQDADPVDDPTAAWPAELPAPTM